MSATAIWNEKFSIREPLDSKNLAILNYQGQNRAIFDVLCGQTREKFD